MTSSLVTVVVPIYNVEKYLDRCIESIVNQSYSNLEIILVDDGSPDRCPEMCDDWAKKDRRIKVVHKKNAGLGMARNTGIEHATGQYIFFFDSDDYVDTRIVEKCVASALKYRSDAVIYGRCEVYEDGKIIEKRLRAPKEAYLSEAVAQELLPAMFTYHMGFGVSAWGKMFSLDMMKRANLQFVSEREIISEDAYFALEFFGRAKAVSIVNECLYFYYKRENSLSRSFRADRHRQNDNFLVKSLACAQNVGLPDKAISHLIARYHMYVIASMKQLLASGLSKAEKANMLQEMFRSKVLRNSVNARVLNVHKNRLKIFFALFKLRCYFLCKLLLRYKIQN